ncbi:HAMP domain-containing sensor histidine kinase [Desulfovibrio oxyclinae]|uniref:HAMP domain-containing sensor histidine kinase n=1 Tax=Desulfovibrio oxyclinae TaxID=63560 RepID=UPI00037F2A8F|nr:ATP-binding protein [Desulfovibrio oxyclinae]
MILKSFRMRVLLWGGALLLAAMGVVFYYSTTLVGSDLIEDTEERSWRQLQTVRWLALDHRPFQSRLEFDEWITQLGSRLGVRITYIHDGKVLADSEVPFNALDGLEDHGHRPEVLNALHAGKGMDRRRSATLDQEMMYVAWNMPATGGLPAGVLRVATPFSQVRERVGDLRENFFWLMLLTMVAAAGLAALLSRVMSGSIKAFSDLARQIGDGNYSKRIRVIPGGEFYPLAQSVNAMAKKIERHIRTIEDQKGQLRAMFEGMTEGVMTLDAQGRVESYNSALDGMISMPATARGRTPIEVTRRYEVQNLVDSLLSDTATEEDMEPRVIDLLDNRVVEVSAVPYTDHDGGRKIILVFHDITAMKRSEKALKDFVANASHQLRTPLTSIKGYSETLLDSPPKDFEGARGFLEIIVKNANHMSQVISSMLALAKSEQVGKAFRMNAVSGHDALAQAVVDVTPLASDKDVTIRTEVEEGDLAVMGDEEGLLHVFHNLIQNAVKFSPEGGEIRVFASRSDGKVRFCVEDQGPGVAKEHSDKVFERFYRVDENTIDGQGGAGLGLAICRRIVRNFGGDIWHDGAGRDGSGARFCFSLDAAEKN